MLPALAKNPLIRSRLVMDRVDGEGDTKERVTKLRELIKEAAETLNSNSKDDKLYAALETCYLRPLRSQEAAAEKIDVSIATIRRHLKAGATRVADVLWQQGNVGLVGNAEPHVKDARTLIWDSTQPPLASWRS